MNRAIRCNTLLTTVMLVLALSAVATVPVLADSGSTPPTTGPSNGGRTSHPGSSSNSLSQVPPGTKVVVLDGNGSEVPLGSQEAQQIIHSGDPVWCPATLSNPTPGMNGCSNPANYSSASLDSLLSYLSANQSLFAKNGTIWIEDNYVSGTNDPAISGFTLDGSGATGYAFGTLSNYALTIQGGWCQSSCLHTIDTSSPSQFTVPIEIENWNNNVTVNDVVITGASGDGLTITTKKNITLTRVQSNSNSNGGAHLDNCEWNGTNCVGAGTVTVNSSQFNDDQDSGLAVYSKEAITLNGVTANSSVTGAGASINNCNATTTSPNLCTSTATVTITGANTSTFSDNYLNGLEVYSNGNISASGLNAAGNSRGYDGVTYDYFYSGGVLLENDYTGSVGTVAIAGNNSLTNNYEDGLDVYSNSVITTNNLTATGNGVQAAPPSGYLWVGVFLENAFTGFSKPITVNGSNTFSNNYDDGMDVLTYGAIKANNLAADSNSHGSGVVLDNCLYYSDVNGTGCQASAQTITLTGLNTFSGNDVDGLDVKSFGNIAAADLNASGNDTDASLTSGAGVLLTNDFASYTTGLNSKGTVFLTGTDLLNNNGWDGLDVSSDGSVKAGNIHAVNNSGAGADLDNSDATSAQPITLTNNNTFNYNGADGLDIYSNGAITVSSMSANDNGGFGAYLDNQHSTLSSGVALTGNDSFNSNYWDGMDIYSIGTIAVNTTTLVADSNGTAGSHSGSGVYLDNSGAPLARTVTLNGTNTFNGNYAQSIDSSLTPVQSAGLFVVSKGSIKVNNLTADNGMDGAGAYLDNSAGSATATITLTGFGTFDDNAGDGLFINSHGTVTLTKVIADDNQGNSGSLYNGEGLNVTTTGKLVLTCGEFVNNADYGIELDTTGTATVSGATLIDNQHNPLPSGDTPDQTGGGIVLPLVRTCGLP